MISKFVEVSTHKIFGIVIVETPIFQCQIHQIFVENMEDWKKQIPNPNDSTLLTGLSFNEFAIISKEILEYTEKLMASEELVKSLIEGKENAK